MLTIFHLPLINEPRVQISDAASPDIGVEFVGALRFSNRLNVFSSAIALLCKTHLLFLFD